MNEVQVDLDEDGRIHLSRAGYGNGIYTLETTEALRAFFQAERDKELGRWRDPENPDLVLYPDKEGHYIRQPAVTVINETTGGSASCGSDDSLSTSGVGATTSVHVWRATARRYFEAHPDPKPWDAAQPDEVWALTINNEREEVFRCGENGLYSLKTGNPIGSLLSCSHNKITAGRRIWPEGEAS